MKITLLYVPFSDHTSADMVAQILLEEKLIACVNISTIESIYPWQGEICKEGEKIALFKTSIKLETECRKVISAHHPYDVPCILSWQADVNDEYGLWVHGQLKD